MDSKINWHENPVEFIRQNLTAEEILLQLAEEATELAQAALKCVRAQRGTNPTPITPEQAMANVLEEYGDVLNCVEPLVTPTQHELAMDTRRSKRERWVRRIQDSTPHRPADPVRAAGGRYCRECGCWMRSDVPGEMHCALTAASTKPDDFCNLGEDKNACATCDNWNGESCTAGGYEPSAGMECVNWRKDGGTWTSAHTRR